MTWLSSVLRVGARVKRFSSEKVNASGRVDKNRGKIETVRPFEPSSTVVHPCTSQPMYVHVHRLRTSFVPKLVSDLSHAHPWAHWRRVLCVHKTSLYWQEVSGSKQYRVFHQENSKLKNVQGSTFFSDAILGSSGRIVSIFSRGY